MQDRYFPSYTIGTDAFNKFDEICKKLGNKFILIGGKKALEASEQKLMSCISKDFIVADRIIYGDECTEERAVFLYNAYKTAEVDFVVGVGGGKALDTAKYFADLLGVPVVTIPTIASTCAAASCLSVVYTPEHIFKKFVYYKKPAYHCFIDTEIIVNAPYKYFRAGIGDTLAKHYEVEFSARNRELDYSSQLGLTISNMCNVPLMKYAKKALDGCRKQQATNEAEQIILAIIISTGMVSMLINPDYNGAMAHALFYGLTNIKDFEKKYLHGDVVGYCTAVQLAVDNNLEEAKKIVSFLKEIGIETSLSERNIPCNIDYLDVVLESSLNDPDMQVIPYPVTKQMLFEGISVIEKM